MVCLFNIVSTWSNIYFKLSKLTSEINAYKNNVVNGEVDGLDPREIELFLEEIMSLTQLGEDYTEHMVSKIKGLSQVDPELTLRRKRSGVGILVKKAIKIDEHVMASLTTSMVDDGFYVLQRCCRRSISTSNIHSVIAALSSAVSLLGGEYNDALRQKMREPNLGAKLFLGGVGVQKTGIDIATALNYMDVSSEYALKQRHEIEEQCAEELREYQDRCTCLVKV
nr:conserved oligomeric Golgi complex subunit 4 [Tanacetum cinerariifolium]